MVGSSPAADAFSSPQYLQMSAAAPPESASTSTGRDLPDTELCGSSASFTHRSVVASPPATSTTFGVSIPSPLTSSSQISRSNAERSTSSGGVVATPAASAAATGLPSTAATGLPSTRRKWVWCGSSGTTPEPVTEPRFAA